MNLGSHTYEFEQLKGLLAQSMAREPGGARARIYESRTGGSLECDPNVLYCHPSPRVQAIGAGSVVKLPLRPDQVAFAYCRLLGQECTDEDALREFNKLLKSYLSEHP